MRYMRMTQESQDTLLERDGYGVRVARARDYKSLSPREGIESFRVARADNLAVLSRVSISEWERRGTQEGVGSIALCDIPAMMAEHDAAHRAEITDWMSGQRAKVKGQRRGVQV